jgi:hypothetical protein
MTSSPSIRVNVYLLGQERNQKEKYVGSGRTGRRPIDGYYVTFWRILLRFPEIMAWEMFWTDSVQVTRFVDSASHKGLRAASGKYRRIGPPPWEPPQVAAQCSGSILLRK